MKIYLGLRLLTVSALCSALTLLPPSYAWQGFLNHAAEFDKTDIQGFMLAVQDCCRVASALCKVPAKIVDEFKTFTS